MARTEELILAAGIRNRCLGLEPVILALIEGLVLTDGCHERQLTDNRTRFVCDLNLVVEPEHRLQVPFNESAGNPTCHLPSGIKVGQVLTRVVGVGSALTSVEMETKAGHPGSEASQSSLQLPAGERIATRTAQHEGTAALTLVGVWRCGNASRAGGETTHGT